MALAIPERTPCPFFENLKGSVDADSSDIKRCAFIERQDLAAAFVNPFQSREGATLIVPTRHAPTVLALTEPEAEALARLVRRTARSIHDAFDVVGLNIYQNNGIASGQEIPHYHVHVMPRYPAEQPDELFGRRAVLVPFVERARLARMIADNLPRWLRPGPRR